jgi:hypothetical protein
LKTRRTKADAAASLSNAMQSAIASRSFNADSDQTILAIVTFYVLPEHLK